MMARKLRFGMVGGGQGAFIGGIHRIAAQMDGQAELLAGAFSSDAARSKASGAALHLDPARVYGSCAQMAAAEARRPAADRLDFVSIVTPNHEHYPQAKLLLEAGFNVVCDKPATLSVAEALALRDVVAKTRKVFVLTHNYTGNVMVRQARELVRRGELGKLRKVVVEYSQGWLSKPLETSGQKQAEWRTDPARAGAAGCVGDIGTHAHNLATYISGLRVESLCADVTTFVPGRRLDDDATVLLRFAGGAKGVLHCSQISIGQANNLNIRVYGELASLEWRQEFPNELIVTREGKAPETWRRGEAYVDAQVNQENRIPAGHPEGYLEAFANIYRDAFRAIAAEVQGQPFPGDVQFPTIDDGVEGMRFIEAVVASARQGSCWVGLTLT